MTDSQIPRPTLKLSLKPKTLESLVDRIPKQTVIIPNKLEPKDKITNEKSKAAISAKEVNPQAAVTDGLLPVIPTPKQKQKKTNEKPEKIKKSVIPPPVLQPYDFFEVYGKLHAKFRAIISLKNPKALAIGISKSIREASGLSKKNAELWTAEYLRRSQYYKKIHTAGADRYNLQGEIVGSVTQEQCDARTEIFKKFKMKTKKTQQSPQEINQ